MGCKITDLLNKIENIKTKITDASYIDLVNSLAIIKKDQDNETRRIRRLKKKAYKLHFQLTAITDYAIAQEYDTDGDGDLVFMETF